MKLNFLNRIYAVLILAVSLGACFTHGPLTGLVVGTMMASAFLFSLKANPYALGAYEIGTSNTGDALSTMSPDDVRTLWQTGIDVFEQSSDFYNAMEGGQDSLIYTKTDTSKGRGQDIRFTVMSGFYDEAHLGEELFETMDDFEDILIGGHDLKVDWIRHAYSLSERMEEVMGMRNEIRLGLNEELGKWLGRTKTDMLNMMFLHKLEAENTVYAGGLNFDTLDSSAVLNFDEIVSMGAQVERQGGKPAQMGSDRDGNPIHKNCVVATSDALFSLELDPQYKQLLRETNDIANAKLIFDGGYSNVRGHIIKKYIPIDHDGEGSIGSALNARAKLGTAITAGTAVFDIAGGGNATAAAKTKKKYFKFFPGYAWRFSTADILAPASEERYLLIVNPPNAPVDPNKWGFYAYTTGNNGNKITITKRLGPVATGAQETTIGGVTWNAGAFASKSTTVHPAGALILPVNRLGQYFLDSLMLTRRCAYRGYGKYRNHRSEEEKEGGFLMRKFITSVFGQAPRRDRNESVPGVVRLRHAGQIAGVPLPQIGA